MRKRLCSKTTLSVLHTYSCLKVHAPYILSNTVFLQGREDFTITPSVSAAPDFHSGESVKRYKIHIVCSLFKKLLRHASCVFVLWKHIWKTESCWQRYTQKNKGYNTELSFFRLQPHGIRTRLCSRFMPAKSTPRDTSACFLWKMYTANKITEELGWTSLRGIWKYRGQFHAKQKGEKQSFWWTLARRLMPLYYA